MMKWKCAAAAAATLATALASPALAQSPGGWSHVEDADFHFTIDMPCTPAKSDEMMNSGGPAYLTRTYPCDLAGAGAIVVDVGDMTAAASGGAYDRTKVINAAMDGIVNSLKFQIDADTLFNDGDVQGRDVRGHGAQGVAHIRVIDRHGKVYEIISLGPTDVPAQDTQVVDSLRFTD